MMLGKIARATTKIVHSREVQHDAALFCGALAVTGIIGDFANGVPLTWDVLAAAVIAAGRRAFVQRVQGR